MSNSALATLTINSPNNSGKRTHAIDRITPHCMAGQLSARKCGELFSRSSYTASGQAERLLFMCRKADGRGAAAPRVTIRGP